MPYKLKSEIEWYQDGELATGTFTSTTPDGTANRPLEDLFDNIQFVKDDLDTNYYTKTEVDSLVAGSGPDLSNYYTKTESDGRYYTQTQLSSSGLASVHWGNITNSTHNTLGGLQGGTSGQYYHLSQTEYTDVLTLIGGSGGGGGGFTNAVLYQTSGSFAIPTGVTKVRVTAIGGGGSGNFNFISPSSNGGDTFVNYGGISISAFGGSGGGIAAQVTTVYTKPGAGGLSSVVGAPLFFMNGNGNCGEYAQFSAFYTPGRGGSSLLGNGGFGDTSNPPVDVSATFGGGGSGFNTLGAGTPAAGSGAGAGGFAIAILDTTSGGSIIFTVGGGGSPGFVPNQPSTAGADGVVLLEY